MTSQVVGAGSQYYWTPFDGSGAWSVTVYDAGSRSMLGNGTRFPSISQYTNPRLNAAMARSTSPSAPKRCQAGNRTGFAPCQASS